MYGLQLGKVLNGQKKEGFELKILFVSLGCDKNLVDTEMMLGMLQEQGFTFTQDEQEAEVIVVNTCCFIGDAKEEHQYFA